MYAVIKTGGKQYRVSPGDLMVVEKLAGEPGANVSFGDVLMVGEGDAVVIGAPTVKGASVLATLVETRKGEKIKVFKKIRRQNYRRTGGHRQIETALRVIGITGADGKTTKWDGKVDLTTKGELDARARGLVYVSPEAQAAAYAASKIQTPRKGAGTAQSAPVKGAAPVKKAAAPKAAEVEAKAAPAPKPAAKAAPAPKAEAKAEAPAKKAAAAPKAAAKAEAAPKKAAAPKAAATKAAAKPAAKAAPAAEKKAAAPKKAAAAPKKDKSAK
jgi:large subunit ribosomal protein L21